jgi:hypothetical protein
MPRLCSKSSRSYPGRPVRHAVLLCGTAPCAATLKVTGQESAEVIVGVGETSPVEAGRTHPTEGPNTEHGKVPL